MEKQRYVGLFEEIPFTYFIQSPIGLVPKDYGKDVRLTFHLSCPRSGQSINSETPDELCSVNYPDFSEAMQLCLKLTDGKSNEIVFSGKSDMKCTFRNLPISRLDFILLIMKATNPEDVKTYYFVDKCLPFGASISYSLFKEFFNAVAHIFTYHTGKKTMNYLGGKYFVTLLKSLCDGQISAFLEIYHLICFPVSLEKTEWGTPSIVFLGFLIDSINQIICIPMDKVKRAVDLILQMLNKTNSEDHFV